MQLATKLEGYLASPQQRATWLRMRDLPLERFSVFAAAWVDGVLEPDAVRRAHAGLIQAHEVLHTYFHAEPGMTFPLQIVQEQSLADAIEFRVAPGANESQVLDALRDEARRRTFVSSGECLHWTCLVTFAPDRHLLATAQSALIQDIAGAMFFLERLVQLSRGGPALDAEEPLQYIDIAHFFNDILTSERSAEGRAYWAGIRWPAAARSGAGSKEQGRTTRQEVDVPSELWRSLGQLSRRLGVRQQALLLAAWTILIGRLTESDSVPISCALDGRTDPKLAELPGRFERDVPMVADLSAERTVEALLQDLDKLIGTASRWQDCFAWEKLGPTKSVGPPFSSFAFAWREFVTTQIRPCSCEDSSIAFGLRLVCEVSADGLRLVVELGDSAFHPFVGVGDVARQLAVVIADMIARPGSFTTELALTDSDEALQLVRFAEGPVIAFDAPESLTELIFERFVQHDTSTAVICREKSLSYGELSRRARGLASNLSQQTRTEGGVVALFMPRSSEYLIGALAALCAGAAFLPLDPSLPDRRLLDIVADARPMAIITAVGLEERAARIAGTPVLVIDETRPVDDRLLSPVRNAAAAAYLMYTSGSTGRPKGVVVPQRALRNFLLWSAAEMPLRPADRVLFRSAIGFDAAVWEMFAPLLDGATLVVLPGAGSSDGMEIGRALCDAGVSVLKTTPSLLSLLLELEVFEQAKSLRLVLCGAERMTPALAGRFLASGTNATLFNMYGPTEACIDVAFHRVTAGEYGAGVPIGRPIANVRLHVLDRHLRPVPRGMAGELFIGGMNLATGYSGSPEIDGLAFVEDPFRAGERLFRSGDRVRQDAAGNLEFLGRVDHQVKVRGARVELQEIEAVLSMHPEVKQCAVRVLSRAGTDQLVAYFVPSGKQTGSGGNDLREYVAARLPDYMIPALFVPLEEMPLNSSGKVDRDRLPEPDGEAGRADFVAPRNPTEVALAAIWERVLGIKDIGVTDNFFELGGDSILSVQVVAQAAKAGLNLTVRQLFERRTIASIGEAISAAPKVAVDQGVVVGGMPLMPIQRRLLARELPDVNHFNQSMLFELDPQVNLGAVNLALGLLSVHHDALRSRLRREPGGWRLEIVPPGKHDTAEVHDLSGIVDAAERHRRIEAIAQAIQRSLDLSSGPILKVAVFRQPTGETWRMLFVCHHVAIDGVSWRIFLEDFSSLYTALLATEGPSLPPKTTSFADWSRRIEDIGRRGLVVAQASYWLNPTRLSVTPLPLDFPERSHENLIGDTNTHVVKLDEMRTRTLLQALPRAYGTQINDVLLTALVCAIEDWTGQTALLVDLDAHGREELFDDVNLSRTIGWFTTVYPLLLKVQPNEVPSARLRSVAEQLQQVPDRGISYGILRYGDGSPEVAEKLAGFPPSQISFNYLGQLDQVVALPPLLGWSAEDAGHTQCPNGLRQHLIELNSFVIGGRFEMQWTYGRTLFRPDTMLRLADRYLAALDGLMQLAGEDHNRC
ncbi:amino acid adenylation domain-containing protein [Bradyrhizobium sp.]